MTERTKITRRQFLGQTAAAMAAVARPKPDIETGLMEVSKPKEQVVPNNFQQLTWLTDEKGKNYLWGRLGNKLGYYQEGNWKEVGEGNNYCAKINPETKRVEVLVVQKTGAVEKLLWGEVEDGGDCQLNSIAEYSNEAIDNLSLTYGTYVNDESKKIPVRAYGLTRKSSPEGRKRVYVGLCRANDRSWIEQEILWDNAESPDDVQLAIADNGMMSIYLQSKINSESVTTGWLKPAYLTGLGKMVVAPIAFAVSRRDTDLINCSVGMSAYVVDEKKGYVLATAVSFKEAGFLEFWYGPKSNAPSGAKKTIELKSEDIKNDNIPFITKITKNNLTQFALEDSLLNVSLWTVGDVSPAQSQESQPASFQFLGNNYAAIASPGTSVQPGQAIVYREYPGYMFYQTPSLTRALPAAAWEIQIQKEEEGASVVYIYPNDKGESIASKTPLIYRRPVFGPLI